MNIKGLGRYAKFITAIAGQALVYAQATYGTSNRWVELATAAAAALAVFAVPNAAKPAQATAITQAVSTTGPVPPKATP